MNITFLGGAGTTTGSKYRFDIHGKKVLVECGVFQGRRKEAFEKNRQMPVNASEIDLVILSHAHLDHCGNLPTLVNRGFSGEIVCTPATADLCDIMLRDSAYLQVKDVEYVNKRRVEQGRKPFEPLYRPEDIDAVMKRFAPVEYGKPFVVAPGAEAVFHDAGHLLGSAQVVFNVTAHGHRTQRFLFTGDLGRRGMPILKDPEVIGDVDVLMTESTYGNRLHPPAADVVGRLKSFIEDIHAQKSKLIIPSFSVGRTQEIVYFLHEIYKQGRIPDVPVYVDSPLSTRATGIYMDHRECWDAETTGSFFAGDLPFQFRHLKYVDNTDDSKRLNSTPGPAVIISASGMCEGGRILHHLKYGVGDPRNIVLFVGYQAENTLGRRIVEHVSPVRIFGEEHEVRARIHTINALSAHADRNEILEHVKGCGSKVQTAFVVHGEEQQAGGLAQALRSTGIPDVVVPAEGQTVSGVLE